MHCSTYVGVGRTKENFGTLPAYILAIGTEYTVSSTTRWGPMDVDGTWTRRDVWMAVQAHGRLNGMWT